MDTTTTVESPTKHNVILLSILGILLGSAIGAGIVFYFFKDAVFFNIPKAETQSLTYPNPEAIKVPEINLKSNILLPKAIVSEEYYVAINKIVDDLQAVGNNNVSVLVPILNTIKQKSAVRDFSGFFDLVTEAKNEIKKDTTLLQTVRANIASMKQVNETTIKDQDVRNQTNILLASSDILVQEFLTYFSLTDETLSGSLPSQALLDKLSAQITTLSAANIKVQNDLSTLLATIKQKNDALIKK